jgi:hypothetical protein
MYASNRINSGSILNFDPVLHHSESGQTPPRSAEGCARTQTAPKPKRLPTCRRAIVLQNRFHFKIPFATSSVLQINKRKSGIRGNISFRVNPPERCSAQICRPPAYLRATSLLCVQVAQNSVTTRRCRFENWFLLAAESFDLRDRALWVVICLE